MYIRTFTGVAMLLAVILAVVALSKPVPAHATTTLLGRYALGTAWRDGLGPVSDGAAGCYDSDGITPIYLVDSLSNGNVGFAHWKLVGGKCTTHIDLLRSAYNNATTNGKAYMRWHEMDHLRGWGHNEGHTPDHNGTRSSGENAANPHTIPVNTSTFTGSVY